MSTSVVFTYYYACSGAVHRASSYTIQVNPAGDTFSASNNFLLNQNGVITPPVSGPGGTFTFSYVVPGTCSASATGSFAVSSPTGLSIQAKALCMWEKLLT